jgi:hypothetical protein
MMEAHKMSAIKFPRTMSTQERHDLIADAIDNWMAETESNGLQQSVLDLLGTTGDASVPQEWEWGADLIRAVVDGLRSSKDLDSEAFQTYQDLMQDPSVVGSVQRWVNGYVGQRVSYWGEQFQEELDAAFSGDVPEKARLVECLATLHEMTSFLQAVHDSIAE